MILVLSGTADGRLIVQELVNRGYPVLASAATPYGGELLTGCGAEVRVGRLSLNGLVELINKRHITMLVDATHPYARQVSDLAREACTLTSTPYLRYQRKPIPLPDDHPLLYRAVNYHEAAYLAVQLGKVIFLTTGSKTVDIFFNVARQYHCRLVVRVLPEPEVITRCRQLGLNPSDIVAMQGPFTLELNRAILKQYGAEVMVTKESGITGGTDTKVSAAMELNLPVVVVNRPPAPPEAVTNLQELIVKINSWKEGANK